MPPTSIPQLARTYLGPAAARELAREHKASRLNLTLATLRIQRGLSPDDQADRMNTSLETVRRIEESTADDITPDEVRAYLYATLGSPPSLAAPPPGTPISRLATPATEAAAATKESGDGSQESGDGSQESGDRISGEQAASKRPRRRKSPISPETPPAPQEKLKAKPLKAKHLPPAAPQPWPPDLPSQVAAIKALLPLVPHPPTPELLAPHFLRTKPSKIAPILEALKVMGVV